MARKRKARELTVTAASQLTPNMRRLTLQGDDLADFPDDAEGAYFKLVFPYLAVRAGAGDVRQY